MENTPDIILFWFFIIAIFILMVVSQIAAIILLKKDKEQSTKKIQFAGKISLALSIICSIPVFLIIGYILYIYIG